MAKQSKREARQTAPLVIFQSGCIYVLTNPFYLHRMYSFAQTLRLASALIGFADPG
jgi:hypothetical protein